MTDPASGEARFMHAFAHDLRSYLRTMQTRVQLIQRAAAASLPEQENRWLNEAIAAGEDMGRLIGAMVTYCGAAPVRETMSLALLLRGLRIDLAAMLTDAEAELSIAESASDIAVSRSLSTVLRELVGNSCKFRRPGVPPEIRIASKMTDTENVEVAVADNGSGVASEYMEAIFEPFRRMHSRSDYPGFGLGLALCRRITASNGGTIEAASGPNGGLSVRVVLPVVRAEKA